MNIDKKISMSKRGESALRILEETLRPLGAVWAVGGSTGLLLQGVQLSAEPRDLDLYADEDDARKVHAALRAYALDVQERNETSVYRSLLSHYEIDGVCVELVGAFEVRALGSEYRVDTRYLTESAVRGPGPEGGGKVKLMPLVHELIFNVLRKRPDRYEAVAALCRQTDRQSHRTLLGELAARNRLSEPVLHRLYELLDREEDGDGSRD
ncbi:nucleotidyltransferase domain-containing protein [Paenibacillus puerhi]|uniref:nucleotidyltransferase domain-containing protein n=1 Tax=Paenibacillus puerhi TaxID=2692622 RepID=UPI0013576AC9|nr:hypothetical protein [Paenibacillus puerhi]